MQELSALLNLPGEVTLVLILGGFLFLWWNMRTHNTICERRYEEIKTTLAEVKAQNEEQDRKLASMSRDLNRVIGWMDAQRDDGK